MRPARITGIALLCAIAAAAGLVLLHLGQSIAAGDFAEYGPAFLHGLMLTAWITAATFGMGMVLAVPVALAGLSHHAALRQPAEGFMAMFRYSPLIAQLYLVYYGAGEFSGALEAMGLWWLFKSPIACVLLVFTLNTASYQAFVMRGAVAALPAEQTEAALALGLPRHVTFFKVLAPQALRVALRPLGNELTKMLKASSIASTVTVFDLLGTAKLVYNETLNFDAFVIAAVIYVAAVALTQRGLAALTARLTRHERASPAARRPA